MIAEERECGLRASAFGLRLLSVKLQEILAGRCLKSAVRRLRSEVQTREPKSLSAKPQALLPHLAHQPHQITLRIAEERHPQIMIGHLRYQVRFVFEADAVRVHLEVRGLNIWHSEI
jgi:hypothetical protein